MTFQRNVTPIERAGSVAAGVALAAYGLRGRKSAVSIAAGAMLIARGVAGYCPINEYFERGNDLGDTRSALGGNRGIKLEESVSIRKNASELYNMWRPLANLPGLMRHLERVEVLDDKRSHWVMLGPAKIRFEWDAEIINDVKPDLIAWKSLPGADIVSAGSVKFRERQRRGGLVTEVTVTLQYEPVGGKAGAALAWLAGSSASSILREDLRRFKATLEAGEAPSVDARPHAPRSLVGQLAGVDA